MLQRNRPSYQVPIAVIASFTFLLLPPSSVSAQESLPEKAMQWSGFRGPDGQSLPSFKQLPDTWSNSNNVAWVSDIPGNGWASPIIWNDQVFLFSAVSEGKYKQPSTGIYGNDDIKQLVEQGISEAEASKRILDRDIESTGDSGAVEWILQAIDLQSGKLRWEKLIYRGQASEGRHRKNTYASQTPVTDGDRVYVYIGNVGVFAYSMSGELQWTRRIEPTKTYLDFGPASSPALVATQVIIQNDNEEQPYLLALDKLSGKELWSVNRGQASKPGQSSWATPYIWKHDLRTEIVTLGTEHVIAYDTDGKELWRCQGFTGQPTPTPIADKNLLYIGTGSQNGPFRPLVAFRPGADGNISPDSKFVAWFSSKASSYTPSPLVYENRVYTIEDRGVLTVLDSVNGKEIYRQRVGQGGSTFSSSPWAYSGKIFLLSEDGDTFVVQSGDQYKELHRNQLSEMTLASPAFAENCILIRTASKLYCFRQ